MVKIIYMVKTLKKCKKTNVKPQKRSEKFSEIKSNSIPKKLQKNRTKN